MSGLRLSSRRTRQPCPVSHAGCDAKTDERTDRRGAAGHVEIGGQRRKAERGGEQEYRRPVGGDRDVGLGRDPGSPDGRRPVSRVAAGFNRNDPFIDARSIGTDLA
jgi:hypothetical protein